MVFMSKVRTFISNSSEGSRLLCPHLNGHSLKGVTLIEASFNNAPLECECGRTKESVGISPRSRSHALPFMVNYLEQIREGLSMTSIITYVDADGVLVSEAERAARVREKYMAPSHGAVYIAYDFLPT